MADLHVRQASSWSTTLYAAAALDDGIPGAQQTASVAKAYVSRAAREVAHGSMQVFGGIAFTEEHPAHRFLRRIVVREQQFGDAAHHERAARPEPGRRRGSAGARPIRIRRRERDDGAGGGITDAEELGFNDPPRNGWSGSPRAPTPRSSGRCWPTSFMTRVG